ncbi:(2Fe-2S)-binding protein [Streptomyces sp. ME19-01-6]|uniref:(2Fe-2S)-binding protein n=1 Tax=Streptomyces sp. ME19-01-6 TaxID=3028686 RepID=UPI0029B15D52|nr:(2Fe-2S)-binding protein [Streptomyces sp. ME19-01-6]MDX3232993.1 (2Fe-2S)-binding protein [Streptomyces sp. ME19-01-6]
MPPEMPPGNLPCRLSFDGRTIHARPGQSVGAALVAAGVVAWRATRGEGRPRGLFCGIGVCYDCLITVDGRPDQRACLVPAADGMRLESGLAGRAADARER